ncbi:MAG TPA: pantoate--beta-alanine ligase [Planctomycetota bacterium]|jgi:pantoate--beta-alanine ligase|nr:pantoate--beta-alanine ligase [Planctomycetota bacterium]
MIRIEDGRSMRRWSESLRREGTSLGFVPTMGALHEGHLSLVRRSRDECARTAVSIFVNPHQFRGGEDYERYPRPLERDAALLEREGVDALFAPTVEEVYPPGFSTRVVPGPLGDRYEGKSRPGHFSGVLTVVAKLFSVVGPDRAYFGRKDAQQLALVARMARDLDLPVEVVPCPTLRDADGVALSSRNSFLSPRERETARCLSRALARARAAWAEGAREAAVLRGLLRETVAASPGAELDYAAVVDPDTFEEAEGTLRAALALLAVRVGATRLLDNARLDLEPA